MDFNFHPASPILRVENLALSLEYYQNQLGFTIDWVYEEIFASVSRGPANIMLSQGDQGLGRAWLYIGIGDADLLYEEYGESGAKVRQPPTNFSWAYEMQVEDLDGNVIRFGADPKDNIPYGPWLDMEGKLWE